MADVSAYPAHISIDYPGQMDRLSSFFRFFWAIPILVIIGLISGGSSYRVVNEAGEVIRASSSGITAGLFMATVLMIVFRQRYPRWWFDFALELGRFSARVCAYVLLLTDRYPSTVDQQSVHLDVTYPDVERDLNRWLPLVKWLLAIPHFIVLAILGIAVVLASIFAWVVVVITGRYPRDLFEFVVGVFRWATRVWAYAFLLVTDEYPPFSLR